MSDTLLKTSKALGDETRLSIYRYLDRPGKDPVSIKQLAKHFKLHINAVRQHLAKLEEAGLVYSETDKPVTSGRPQRVYKIKGPIHEMDILPRDYKLLCEMLLEFLASSKISIEEIKDFGHQWGKRHAQTPVEKGALPRSSEEISRLLISQFSGLGFEPEIISLSDQRINIRLQNCIFREMVDSHPEWVCPLVHGVLEGILVPFMGHPRTLLENGIAHGKESCKVEVILKTP